MLIPSLYPPSMPRLSILPPSAQAWLDSFDSGQASPILEAKGSSDKILTLPDEILTIILKLATLKFSSQSPHCPCRTIHSFAAVKALALVCRRFYCILRPLFHYSIDLRLPAKVETGSLYRKLRNNRPIWQFFQVLSVWIGWLDPEKQDEGFWLVKEVIFWLKKMRCLTIYGYGGWYDTESSTHWFLSQDIVASMHSLTHLTIRNMCLGTSLRELPSLRFLDIQRASLPNDKIMLQEPEVSQIRFSYVSDLGISRLQGVDVTLHFIKISSKTSREIVMQSDDFEMAVFRRCTAQT